MAVAFVAVSSLSPPADDAQFAFCAANITDTWVFGRVLGRKSQQRFSQMSHGNIADVPLGVQWTLASRAVAKTEDPEVVGRWLYELYAAQQTAFANNFQLIAFLRVPVDAEHELYAPLGPDETFLGAQIQK